MLLVRKDMGKRNNLIALTSTVILVNNDQYLLDKSRILGDRIGLA